MKRRLSLEKLECRRLLTTEGSFEDWTRYVIANDTETTTSAVVAGISGTVSKNQQNAQHYNFLWPEDVDRNGTLSAIDALLVINKINSKELNLPTVPVGLPSISVDVNGDNQLSPIDALFVVNAINQGATSPIASITAEGTFFEDQLFGKLVHKTGDTCNSNHIRLNADGYISGTFEGYIQVAKLHTVALRQQVELRDDASSKFVWGTRHITQSTLVLTGWGIADVDVILKGGAFDLYEGQCEFPYSENEDIDAEFLGHVSVRGAYEVHITVTTSYYILGTPDDAFEGFVAGLLNTAETAASVDISIQAGYMHAGGNLYADARQSSFSEGKNILQYSLNDVGTFDAKGAEALEMSMKSVRVRSLMYQVGGDWLEEQYRLSTSTVHSRPQALTGTATVEVLRQGEVSGPFFGDLARIPIGEPIMAFVRGPTDFKALQAHDEVFAKGLWTYNQLFNGL